MKTQFLTETIPYTGVELSPHFILRRTGLLGNALIAFIGPCAVKTEHLVDWEDRLENEFITAHSMVHFLGEFFGFTLKEMILFQRLLVASALESLATLPSPPPARRSGND